MTLYPTAPPRNPVHTSYPTAPPQNPVQTSVPTPTNSETLTPPNRPGEWSLKQIQEALKRRLPPELTDTIKEKSNARYIPWYNVVLILDKYAPGWEWKITQTQISRDRIFFIGQLTIPTSDGPITREATGTEELKRKKETKNNQTGEVTHEIVELSYGDPSSNAESMAFRRAAAKFGLGLYLYMERRNKR